MKMTNEEAVKIIESVGPDSSVYGWRKVADALNLAITALQNQSKYENALERAADYINDCDDCPVKECAGVTSVINIDECEEKKIISAWKRKAGLEVADNEQM
jgi:hypothetical protein